MALVLAAPIAAPVCHNPLASLPGAPLFCRAISLLLCAMASSSHLQHISTPDAPGNIAAYSQAVVSGSLVFASGSIGLDTNVRHRPVTRLWHALGPTDPLTGDTV